jgi:hypothetical protein
MTPKTRFLLRLIIIIALLPVIGWAAITTLLPVYLQYFLLPALAARADIDNFHARRLFIGLTEAGGGFAIGPEKSPAVAVSALTASYHPVALLAGKLEEISVSGLEIHFVFTDNQLIIDDPGLQKLFTSPSPAKDKEGAGETIQLPLAVKRVTIRQSALICRMADRVIRLPFAAYADLAATGAPSGPLQVQLQLFPGEQEIDLAAALDLKQQKAHLVFSTNNINPRHFASLTNLPAGLQLDTRADFSGSADVGLSPFVLSAIKAQLSLRDSSMHYHDISLSQQKAPQQETPPTTIIFSGSRQDISQPLLFTVTGSLPDLAVDMRGTVLSLPSPSFDIKGSVAADTISIDSVARLRLTAENENLTLEVPTIALQAAITRQGKEAFHLQADLTIDGASFDHHSSGTRAEGGHLTLPLSWPLSDERKNGKLTLTKITWQEKEIGALAGTVWLQEKKLGMTADFHSRLLQGVTALLSLSADFSGEAGRSELSLTIPPAKLADFSPARIFPQAKDITFSGLINGEAQLSLADGRLTGNARLSLKNGSLDLAKRKITVSGIDTTLTFPFLPQLRSAPNQKLNFASARIGEFAVNGGSLHFTVESEGSFFLEKGNFNWAEGSVNTYALRFAENHLQPEMIFYCTKLKLARILEQVGIKNVEGDGTVNGRIPVSFSEGKITFEPSFLYSTPGEGGVIRIAGGDFLTQAIPLDSPQFGQLDFAQEALRNFSYNWAKVHLFSDNDTLVMQLSLDGKPASPLPFTYDSATGGLRRIHVETGQGISQPILLDVNFRFPLNTFLDYDKNFKDLLQRVR